MRDLYIHIADKTMLRSEVDWEKVDLKLIRGENLEIESDIEYECYAWTEYADHPDKKTPWAELPDLASPEFISIGSEAEIAAFAWRMGVFSQAQDPGFTLYLWAHLGRGWMSLGHSSHDCAPIVASNFKQIGL